MRLRAALRRKSWGVRPTLPRFRSVLPKAEFAAGGIPDISEVPKIENTISWFRERLAQLAKRDRNFFQGTREGYRQGLVILYDFAGKCDLAAIFFNHRPRDFLCGSRPTSAEVQERKRGSQFFGHSVAKSIEFRKIEKSFSRS